MGTRQSVWCKAHLVDGCLLTLFHVAGLVSLAGCGAESKVAPTASSDRSATAAPVVESASVDVPTDKPEVSDTIFPPAAPANDAAMASSAADINSELAVADSDTATDDRSPGTETSATEATPAGPDVSTNSTEVTEAATVGSAAAKLEEKLAALEIPPAWLETVQPKWDTAKPWKEARLEIRRLLGKGDDTSRREGIRLTWDYLQKDDIGDGHEYGMYLFLGNEPLWAVHVFREWLAKDDHSYPPYFGVQSLTALYTHYGLFAEAEKVLNQGMTFKSPDAKWDEVRAAELHDSYGDLYAAWGKVDQAKTSYQEAIRLYPLGKPPYGGHLLPRKAKKVQAKLDLLSMASLDNASLRDGRYTETALGYSGDIELAVEVKGGRIANVKVMKHEEKIDQNACVLIPQRISAQVSLQVDGISGATVTKDAIVSGTLTALQKAGLK